MRCKPVVWASARCTQQSQHHQHQPQQLGSFSNDPWNKRRGLSRIEEEWDQIRSSQCAGRDFFLSALWRLAPFSPFVSQFFCGRPLWSGRIFWAFALMGGEIYGNDVQKWKSETKGWRWGVGKVGVTKLWRIAAPHPHQHFFTTVEVNRFTGDLALANWEEQYNGAKLVVRREITEFINHVYDTRINPDRLRRGIFERSC